MTYVKNSIIPELKQLLVPFNHRLKPFLCVFGSRKRLREGEAVLVLFAGTLSQDNINFQGERMKSGVGFFLWLGTKKKVTLVYKACDISSVALTFSKYLCSCFLVFVNLWGRLLSAGKLFCYIQNIVNSL